MVKQQRLSKFSWIFFVCTLLVNFILLVNTKFTLWPEMVVYPYLLNNGFAIYRDLINPYPPSVTYLFAFLFKQFSYSVNSYQLFTWFVVTLINVAVYLVSLKSFGSKKGALLSTAFFIFFSILFGINGLWFDLIQTPFIILSVYFFTKAIKEKSIGELDNTFLFAVIAVFIKQQAFWLVLFYVLAMGFVYRNKTISLLIKLPKTCLIVLTFIFAHLFLFTKQGLFADFIQWVILFPLKASSQNGYFSPPSLRQLLVVFATFAIFIPTLIKGKKLEKILLFCATSLVIFSYPRFDYFHLIPSLAVLAIIFGKNFNLFHKASILPKVISGLCFIFVVATTFRYMAINWQKEVRFFESDIFASATLLSLTVPNGEIIYVQNGPDQLLPLSGTIPVKPWADEFPWYLENTNVQDRVISGLKNKSPGFVVYKPYDDQGKFELGSYQPENISKYINKNYSNYFQMSDSLWLKKINNDL